MSRCLPHAVKKYVGEIPDRKWATVFCDFYSLLDDETRSKYTLYGLDSRHFENGSQPSVKIGDTSVCLLSESAVYRAMAMIAENEGDFYFALSCLMSVKSCIPKIHNDNDIAAQGRHSVYDKKIDKQIEDMSAKLHESTRNFLKEWGDNHV